MFGVFKRLFSRPSSPPPAAAPVKEESVPAPMPAPPPRPSGPPAAAPAPRPAATSPAPAPIRSAAPTGDMIALPLNEILSCLPEDLAALVLERPGGMFSLSASVAVEQLRKGAVKIPLAQLRKGSPPGTFTSDDAHDDSLIELPLSLVLAAIGPARLARRSDQKRTVVPDEVAGVFGAKDRRVAISPGDSAPATATTAPKAATTAPIAPPPSAPKLPALPPSAPKPAAAPILPKPPTPVGLPHVTPKLTTSIAQGSAVPKASAAAPLPFAATKPASPLPFATTRPAPPPPAAAVPAASDETVVITIEAVSGAWPDPVRQEIQQLNLVSASISIPVSRLESGMKAGRLVFTWAELCGWLSDPLPATANGQSQVELPLGVIAPLFLTKRRAATPRKIVTVGEDVPDLFAGLGRPVAPPPEPAPAPAAIGN